MTLLSTFPAHPGTTLPRFPIYLTFRVPPQIFFLACGFFGEIDEFSEEFLVDSCEIGVVPALDARAVFVSWRLSEPGEEAFYADGFSELFDGVVGVREGLHVRIRGHVAERTHRFPWDLANSPTVF